MMTYSLKKIVNNLYLLLLIVTACTAETVEILEGTPLSSDVPYGEDTETQFGLKENHIADNTRTCTPHQMPTEQCIVYVDANARAHGCGYSWEDALLSIQDGVQSAKDALEAMPALSSCEVWVARGTYYIYTNRKTDTLKLASRVELYGGFNGGEAERNERDFENNKTIISALKNANEDVRVFHVVTGADDAIIDGFVIQDGYARGFRYGAGMYNDRVSPTVRNCTFTNNVSGWYGGGMFNNHNAAIVENCLFLGNEAYGGGGMFNQVSNAQIINCVFKENVADQEGGGIFNHSFSNLLIDQCHFESNEGGVLGGGVSNHYQTSPVFANCTFTDNLAGENGNDVHNSMWSNPVYEEDGTEQTSSGHYEETAGMEHTLLAHDEETEGMAQTLSEFNEEAEESEKTLSDFHGDHVQISEIHEMDNFVSNLPILIIDTNGKNISSTDKMPAHLSIINSGENSLNELSSTDFEFDGPIGIDIRGNSSARFPKKQFGIETWDNNQEDKDVSLLGLPAESDWVLYAPFSDKSLMRNEIAYWISNRIGMYAPRTRFVEVFLNMEGDSKIEDHYWGVYVLIEKIKRNRHRVDIKKLKSDQNSDAEISGGYILRQDWENSESGDCLGGTLPEKTDACVKLYYPKNEDASAQQKKWIADYIAQFESVLAGRDYANPLDGYASYIDVDSFIDYLILNELFRNNDGLRRSTFMHKPRNGKLTMGPYWDCNLCMGNYNHYDNWHAIGWNMHTLPQFESDAIPFWWFRLLEDSNFQTKLIARWRALRMETLTIDAIETKIEETAALLADAKDRNFKRWPIIGAWRKFNPDPIPESWDEEKNRVKSWLKERILWMDDNIQTLGSIDS